MTFEDFKEYHKDASLDYDLPGQYSAFTDLAVIFGVDTDSLDISEAVFQVESLAKEAIQIRRQLNDFGIRTTPLAPNYLDPEPTDSDTFSSEDPEYLDEPPAFIPGDRILYQ